MSAFWQDLLLKVATPAVFIVVVGFVARSLFSQLLSRDLERFKAQVDLKATEHQAELDRMAAQYRADLDRMAFEYQTQFSKLHDKRVEAIAQVYGAIVDVEQAFLEIDLKDVHKTRAGIVHMCEPVSDKMLNALFPKYHCNRIYLNRRLCQQIDEYIKSVNRVLRQAYDVSGEQVNGHEIYRLRSLLRPIRQDLEAAFRAILGVSDETDERSQE